MREIERLDQSLFFQIGKRALLARRHCAGKLIKRLGVIGKALLSADVGFTHVLLTLFVLWRQRAWVIRAAAAYNASRCRAVSVGRRAATW